MSISSLKPLVPHEAIKVVAEGSLTRPQLNHPEGICADSQGFLWCGGEQGEIYRIDPWSGTFEQIGSTDGFALGLNFAGDGMLYVCDSRHKAVFRFDPETRKLELASNGSDSVKMRFPNYPVYHAEQNALFVSDSWGFDGPGPGIWRIDIATGKTELWCDHWFHFANGLALSPDGRTLYLAESRGQRNVYRIPIDEQGQATEVEVLISLPGTILDGLIMDPDGRLYITCYEPSRIYRIDTRKAGAELELVAEDPTAHELCHPTNGVLLGGDLYVSNLGRWHVSKIPLAGI